MARSRGSSLFAASVDESSPTTTNESLLTATTGTAPTPVDWTSLLADEDQYVYEGQAEINSEISSRLSNVTSSESKVETLATLLDEQIKNVARADLFVLCTLTIATQHGVREGVLATVSEAAVKDCVVRAQSKRLKLSSNAAAFLGKHWGNWKDVCNHTDQYTTGLIRELASLCKLGISKDDAKARLRLYISARRVGKTPGALKTPRLQVMDVKGAIAEVKAERMKGVTSLPLSKKRKLTNDTAYHPPGKKAKIQVERSLEDSTSSTHFTPNSQHTHRKPNPQHPDEEPPIDIEEGEVEVEVGRGGARDLTEAFDSPHSNSASDRDGSSTPQGPHSTAPTSPPISPLHTKMKSTSEPPVSEMKTLLERAIAPSSRHNMGNPRSIMMSELAHHWSPTDSRCRSSTISHASEEILQDLKDGKRLNATVVNFVLTKYFSRSMDIFLVDSGELAKWDSGSPWNATVRNTVAMPAQSQHTIGRQSRAQSACRYILPFHHHEFEHWSLFVAIREINPESWTLEHYDSLPQIGPEPYTRSRKAEEIVWAYLGWLLGRSVQSTRYERKQCAAQEDEINCGIYLLANAAAILQGHSTPIDIDPLSFRQKLYLSLRSPVNNSIHKETLSSGMESQLGLSNAEGPLAIKANDALNNLLHPPVDDPVFDGLLLDQSTDDQIAEASPQHPLFIPAYEGVSNHDKISTKDQPNMISASDHEARSQSVAPSTTWPSTSIVASLRQKHAIETRHELQALCKTLDIFKQALRDIESEVPQCEATVLLYTQETDQADKDLKAMNQNVANVEHMQWVSVSQIAKNTYKDKWLAEVYEELKELEMEKEKCETMLRTAIAKKMRLRLDSDTTREKVDVGEEMKRGLEEYLKSYW